MFSVTVLTLASRVVVHALRLLHAGGYTSIDVWLVGADLFTNGFGHVQWRDAFIEDTGGHVLTIGLEHTAVAVHAFIPARCGIVLVPA